MRKRNSVPASLAQLERRFANWRSKRIAGERIPDSLWDAAAKVARQFGINRVATTLRLDYYAVKKRAQAFEVGDASDSVDGNEKQAFVEVALDPVALSTIPDATEHVDPECVVEFVKASGDKMRIQLRGQLPDLVALGNRFWEAD